MKPEREAEVHRLHPRGSTDELVLDRLFADTPLGLAFLDRDCRYRRVSESLAKMNGLAVADHLGHRPSELLGEVGAGAEEMLRSVIETGEPVTDAGVSLPDGRSIVLRFTAVTGDDGHVVGVLAMIQDVTARERVGLDLEQALSHSHRLQQVAASLSAALTVDEVAGVVVRASMEVLGGTCGVLAQRDGAELNVRHRFGMAGRPPGAIPLAARLPMPEAVRTRQVVTIRSLEEWLVRFPDAPPRGDFDGFVAAPLIFEGRATGCMGIGLPGEAEPDQRDLALVGAIGRLGAQALDRARLYEERAYVAATLQRGLLPAELPELEGAEISVTYRPVGDGSEVGGDFYDVTDLGEGSWLVALGDVAGKGAPAAVLSGLVRTTLSAVAQHEDSPADLLRMANRAILRHASGRAEYATAACAIVTRQPDGIRVRVGSAGHPPAIVLRASGGMELLECHGVMLGAADDPEVKERETLLAPGDALVLYTDGVTDANRGTERFGDGRLHELLAALAGQPAQRVTAEVDRAVNAFQAGPPPDDVAVMVLRATGA